MIDGVLRPEASSMDFGKFDDEDYPALTMGQAAELLGVQPAFLRSLDAADVMSPERSTAGHRRYSRRQLRLAARIRELFDEGLTLDAAHRIVVLEDELGAARTRIEELQRDLAGLRRERTSVSDQGRQHDAARH